MMDARQLMRPVSSLSVPQPTDSMLIPPHSSSLLRCVLALGVLCSAKAVAQEKPVSFRNDVMPVLSKAGCNLGTCHGNSKGKGGLALSMRAQFPQRDFLALSRSLGGRRTNPQQPEQSLLLRKATMQLAHEGGRRFFEDSLEYNVLRDWIAAGMPAPTADAPRVTQLTVSTSNEVLVAPRDRLQLKVDVQFSDGTRRDVTETVVYEPADESVLSVSHGGLIRREGMGETTIAVRFLERQRSVRIAFIPARRDFVWTGPRAATSIDRFVFAKLRSLRLNPSPPASDSVFLRRVSLDLIGRIPSGEEARRFVADASPDKRGRLIEQMLQHPDFPTFWAQKWSDLLRNEEKVLDRKGVQAFHSWIRGSIEADKPLNQFAAELVGARGSTYSNAPANYYRAMRDPLTRAESTAQVFLGIRLNCAKCHNHPFDRWTQDDYYGWANLFARVKYKIIENKHEKNLDKHMFEGEQVVYIADGGEVKHPSTGKPVAPRFLGTTQVDATSKRDRLQQLADWLAAPTNRQFARMQANRIWFHLMGRGVVDPIDDFRVTNPPSNPELLEGLADELIRHDFSLRHVLRVIMNSHTYQCSSNPTDSNRDDALSFSHAPLRRLTAEQMADSISSFLGAPISYRGYPAGTWAAQLPGAAAAGTRIPGDDFLRLFGKPERLQSCECERSDAPTLNQTFQMISGPLGNELLGSGQNRLSQLLDSNAPDEQIVDALYWAALSRNPSTQEREATTQLLGRASDRRKMLEDVAWGLMNSNEFLFRQ